MIWTDRHGTIFQYEKGRIHGRDIWTWKVGQGKVQRMISAYGLPTNWLQAHRK